MAPARPANTTPVVNTVGTTMSLAIVAATFVPRMMATRCHSAAHRTAVRGESTRVDTTVAISFAASWNPLKKSNASATKMTKTSAAIRRA